MDKYYWVKMYRLVTKISTWSNFSIFYF